METISIFFGHLEYFMAMSYILWTLGIFYGMKVFFKVLVCSSKKNLATLPLSLLLCILHFRTRTLASIRLSYERK
jgi:hypothetical protein